MDTSWTFVGAEDETGQLTGHPGLAGLPSSPRGKFLWGRWWLQFSVSWQWMIPSARGRHVVLAKQRTKLRQSLMRDVLRIFGYWSTSGLEGCLLTSIPPLLSRGEHLLLLRAGLIKAGEDVVPGWSQLRPQWRGADLQGRKSPLLSGLIIQWWKRGADWSSSAAPPNVCVTSCSKWALWFDSQGQATQIQLPGLLLDAGGPVHIKSVLGQ